MKLKIIKIRHKNGEKGISIVLVAICLLVFLGVSALAVDISHLYVVRNELQNASDAGALAGARDIYGNDPVTGVFVQEEVAKESAHFAAIANKALSEQGAVPVETDKNTDILLGHWAFGIGSLSKDFYPYDGNNPQPPDLTQTTQQLDEDKDFINAVQVTTKRSSYPVASFFAKIFGYDSFTLSADSVAYIGFAGSVEPLAVDQPIAICKQSIIKNDGTLSCNSGRMINSGVGETHNSAGWTNFDQPCGSTNVPKSLVCSGNDNALIFGKEMSATGGQTELLPFLINCWTNAPNLQNDARGMPTKPWKQTLPVIDCPGNNPGCDKLLGVVEVNFLWINPKGSDPKFENIPLIMDDWKCPEIPQDYGPQDITANYVKNTLIQEQRENCWKNFASHFGLLVPGAVGEDDVSVGDLTHSQLSATMFFLPSCDYHEPIGSSGGENFGILAKIPVLVE